MGVAKSTLLNWEDGLRRPIESARVLLARIVRKPLLVLELLCESANFNMQNEAYFALQSTI